VVAGAVAGFFAGAAAATGVVGRLRKAATANEQARIERDEVFAVIAAELEEVANATGRANERAWERGGPRWVERAAS
jgi:hypothetical protein